MSWPFNLEEVPSDAPQKYDLSADSMLQIEPEYFEVIIMIAPAKNHIV